MKPAVIVIGTRPGAIKSIPVYQKLKQFGIKTILIATFQHDQLLQQVLNIFQTSPDINLNIMRENQDLFYLTSSILTKMRDVLKQLNPQVMLVHGDTTTAFSSALAAFYTNTSVAHMEAGLRTGNIHAPFPEELNRKIISEIAITHFAPTSLNVANLLAQGISRKNIYCTGNVIVDALFWMRERIQKKLITIDKVLVEKIKECKKKKLVTILLTAHRRESFHGGLERIFQAMVTFSKQHPDSFIFFPYHPNPYVLSAIKKSGITNVENILCMPPLLYENLIYLILNVDWVATDSGGIQEETMSIGKKVLILRDETERVEGIWEGLGILVGTNKDLIIREMNKLYNSPTKDTTQSNCIYGTGDASSKIASILQRIFFTNKENAIQPLTAPQGRNS